MVAIEVAAAGEPDSDILFGLATFLQSVGQAGTKRRSLKTSAPKTKNFPYAHRIIVYAELIISRSPSALIIEHFLRASCTTGLRPIEWRQAYILGIDPPFQFTLIVKNAKNTNGRANGTFRTLRWRTISDHQRKSIEITIALAASCANYEDYGNVCKNLQANIRGICKKNFKGLHYALYSCRHQFVAMAKNKFSPEGLAALLGQASDQTAFDHYAPPARAGGKKKRKHEIECVDEFDPDIELPEPPGPSEIATVRRRRDSNLKRLKDSRTPPTLDKANIATNEANVSKPRFTIDDFPVPPRHLPTVDPHVQREIEELVQRSKMAAERDAEELREIARKMRQKTHGKSPPTPFKF